MPILIIRKYVSAKELISNSANPNPSQSPRASSSVKNSVLRRIRKRPSEAIINIANTTIPSDNVCLSKFGSITVGFSYIVINAGGGFTIMNIIPLDINAEKTISTINVICLTKGSEKSISGSFGL